MGKPIETLSGGDAAAFGAAIAPFIGAELGTRGLSWTQRTAGRLTALAEQARTTGTLAPAAVFTRGGNYAASTLVTTAAWNAPTVPVGDARVATVSGVLGTADQYGYASNANAWYGAPYNVFNSGGQGWAQQFLYDGRYLEVGVGTTGYAASVRLLVDDRFLSAQFDGAVDGNAWYLKIDLGSAGLRKIALLFGVNTQVNGYVVPAGNRLWRAEASGPRVTVFGDSWTLGGEVASVRASLPHKIGEALGIAHVQASGESGQGWVQAASGQTLLDRIVRGDLIVGGVPDLIFLYGSVNDYDKAQASVAANFASGVSAALAACPNAFVVAASTMRVASLDPGAARNSAILNALNAISSDRLLVLDSYGWITPQANADGNQASYIDGATNHPNAAGAAYLAQRFAAPTIAFLKSRS